jgi:predicted Rossmann fold nucleotide-binding protein DprA/Smf involved in DNA uptake
MAAGEEYELDLLAARSAIATPLLLPQLLELELAGFVHRTPGGRFVRAG